MDILREAGLQEWSAAAIPFLASALPTLMKALVVLLLTFYVGRRASSAFRAAARRSSVDPSIILLGARLIHLGVLILAASILLDLFGVPPSTLVAAIGVVGLAVSLALQDLLRNFFAGIYLLFERPFRLGDTIQVKEHEGVVEHVGFRTMVLRTRSNVEIRIPNSMVVAEVVSNRTHMISPKDEPTSTEEEASA